MGRENSPYLLLDLLDENNELTILPIISCVADRRAVFRYRRLALANFDVLSILLPIPEGYVTVIVCVYSVCLFYLSSKTADPKSLGSF